ncbi:diguanylate cyclase (GGDEF)-like protein [Kineococcus radiotolerans]|uniref:Diguanylate cyclase (GGDEF)-like protein n=1 Tax=Kineococcus radiotolerans TaxID=131568 RepID=A0A7W4XXH5_KINRA|nr:EAL domain-containing protein [Kineococcus radiotolerans]MBB2901200.1 diguanylate cyclase (GGDEF)-like protein [Kineococcus radiotolerans]
MDVEGRGRGGAREDGAGAPAVLLPPVSDFASAAAATLRHLHQRVGMDTWAVARRDGEDYVVLSALDAGRVGMRDGDVMAWDDTFCAATVAGDTPRFSPCVEREPAWERALAATGFPWRSYLSVPMTAPDGTVLGTVCAGSLEPVDPAVGLQLPDVELAADLLATVLGHELRLEREAHRAREAAGRDAVTGLGDRRAWDAALAAEEARAKRLGSTASVLLLALGGLKELNRAEGHDAGDRLIVRAGQVLREHLRPEDLVVRLGGDEFAALLPDADRAAATAALEGLRAALADAGVPASLGVGTRRAATGLPAAWREADAAARVDRAVRAQRARAAAAQPRTPPAGPLDEPPVAFGADGADGAGGDPELTLRIERLLDAARRQLGMEAAVLARFEGEVWTLRHVAAGPGTALVPGLSWDLRGTYCRHVLAGRLSAVVPDAAAHPVTAALPITAALDIGAYVGVPVRFNDGSLYGTLCALSSTPQPELRPRDRGVLEIIAEALGELLTRDHQQALRRRAVLARLDALHREGGPRPVYQPVVELEGLRRVGDEALSRFPHGAPDTWFADAAGVGAGEQLELAAVRAALAQRPLGEGFLSLNVSPAVAASPALARVLQEEDLRTLVVEVTEHEQVSDYTALLRHLAPLRQGGLRIAVDDAGAGFASMRHVLTLQPDFIKLDIGLIRGIDRDGTRRALAAALTTFAHQTGARVIAEGVETAEELDCLRALGVSHGQGYHLGRPAPAPAAVVSGLGA